MRLTSLRLPVIFGDARGQDKYYDLLGHNLYDLCSRMLAWDPDQRITAQGALQSQYCRVSTPRCHTPYHVSKECTAKRQGSRW